MEYVEAPNKWDKKGIGIFLGGGISNCPDWQLALTDSFKLHFEDEPVTIINPRREDFDINDSSQERIQIKWEFDHLALAEAIIFWFSPPTLNPIVLFEYGKHINHNNLFVGCDPEYARKSDVLIQTELARPDIQVASSLGELTTQVVDWYFDA